MEALKKQQQIKEEIKKEKIEMLQVLLLQAGFSKFDIDGGGCCGSPHVTVIHKGGLTLDEDTDFFSLEANKS